MRTRLLACIVAAALGASQPPAPVVRQIDHILFATGPEGAGLVSILRDRFELPVVFDGPAGSPPMPGTAFGFGNVSLEVIPLKPAPGDPPIQPRITSLAVQAVDFAATPDALRARGIDHHPVATGARWTTIGLRGLGHGFFFIQYPHDMDARRAEFARALAQRDGGPLGIVRMREVAIAPAELDDTRVAWQRLLGTPASSAIDLWSVGDGPALRVVSQDDGLRNRIVVIVKDRNRAAAALRRMGIAHEQTEAAVYIDRAALFGLRLTLTSR